MVKNLPVNAGDKRDSPGSSVHGILQAKIMGWVAVPSSRGSSRPRDRTHISCSSWVAGGFFTTDPPRKPGLHPLCFRKWLFVYYKMLVTSLVNNIYPKLIHAKLIFLHLLFLLMILPSNWLPLSVTLDILYIGKDSDAGRDWGQEEKGKTEDEMPGWHHRLDGHESEWTPGDGDGQGGLVCCGSWGCKESDMTEQLIWSDLIWLHSSSNAIFNLPSSVDT